MNIEDLKSNSIFAERLQSSERGRIASVEELKDQGIRFYPNPEIERGMRRGVPQGTPISAALSNLYLISFDLALKAKCDEMTSLYRRYSDDILIICPPDKADEIELEVSRLLLGEHLEVSTHKTERTDFDKDRPLYAQKGAQYLGFKLTENGASIRASSMSRQWRKLQAAIKRAKKSADWRTQKGITGKPYTKKLYRRFTYLNVYDGKAHQTLRNFSSYGRRSAASFGAGNQISRQIKRFERDARRAIESLVKP